MRAHTTAHRLTQMLRTAGMQIVAPQPPSITVTTSEVTEDAAQRLLAQTLRPVKVVGDRWHPSVRGRLEAEGIVCTTPQAETTSESELWLLAEKEALEALESEDLEDLSWPASYASHKRIAFSRETKLQVGQSPGVMVAGGSIEVGLQLVLPRRGVAVASLKEWAQHQCHLAIRKPSPAHDAPPSSQPKKTVLIAGHDLKFIEPFYKHFTQAGIRLLIDFWNGHNRHDREASERLLPQADTIFCEWMLGNAIWYGKNKLDGQRLVGRLHLQEVEHALFPKIPFDRFEAVLFVGPHILRRASLKNPQIQHNGIVVPNGVDVETLQSGPRRTSNGKVLGLVGMVPQRKRVDLALDILRDLRKKDQEYSLRIKGKRPEEYHWMADRPEEMRWYEEQYRRIKEDPYLRDAVFFDKHGNDMPSWYASVDYVLSTSDFESFHFTVADGAASGCTPIVLAWEGADEIYPRRWVFRNVAEAADFIYGGKSFNEAPASYIRLEFGIRKISNKLIEQLM